MATPAPTYTPRDTSNGRLQAGCKPGPGRPRGVQSFETAMRRSFHENADEFADVFTEMLRKGDSKAWGLAMERAYPKPRELVDITSDGGPVAFSWKAVKEPVTLDMEQIEGDAPSAKDDATNNKLAGLGTQLDVPSAPTNIELRATSGTPNNGATNNGATNNGALGSDAPNNGSTNIAPNIEAYDAECIDVESTRIETPDLKRTTRGAEG